jgi:hypothetical protein
MLCKIANKTLLGITTPITVFVVVSETVLLLLLLVVVVVVVLNVTLLILRSFENGLFLIERLNFSFPGMAFKDCP